MIVFRPNVHAYMPGADIVNRPVVAGTTINNWADYANTVFDDLLAIEFRNASSLAEATLYGSAPSIVEQPGGGLVMSSSGLVCNGDTVLNAGVTPAGVNCVFFYSTSTTAGRYEIGTTKSGNMVVYTSGNYYGRLYVGTSGGGDYDSAPAITDGSFGFIDDVVYGGGSSRSALTWPTTGTANNFYIGGHNNNGTAGNRLVGTIKCIVFGTLKAGADGATVASELHTRCATAAL